MIRPLLQRCDQNILGIDLIGKKIFRVGFKERTLSFLLSLPQGSYSDKLRILTPGHMAIPVSINGIQSSALFDTGSDSTIVDLRFVEKHPQFFDLIKNDNGRDAHGNTISSKVLKTKSLNIGPLKLNNVEIVAFDYNNSLRDKMEGTPIILGSDIIHKGQMELRSIRQKMVFGSLGIV